jgi:hypothetical protein
VKNLYAVPTPLSANQEESKIEDFFDPATKATEVGGKAFTAENEFDETTHYGKWIFAKPLSKHTRGLSISVVSSHFLRTSPWEFKSMQSTSLALLHCKKIWAISTHILWSPILSEVARTSLTDMCKFAPTS